MSEIQYREHLIKMGMPTEQVELQIERYRKDEGMRSDVLETSALMSFSDIFRAVKKNQKVYICVHDHEGDMIGGFIGHINITKDDEIKIGDCFISIPFDNIDITSNKIIDMWELGNYFITLRKTRKKHYKRDRIKLKRKRIGK